MLIPAKKLACGFEIPAFGMGSWLLGGDHKRKPNNDNAADIASLQQGLEHGINLIDTAEMYAEGAAEEIVGKTIKGYERSRLFITSKVWSNHYKYDDVLRACEASLERLDTDYLDLYLIHHPSDEVPLRETMKALNRLADQKIIRAIGVSNFKAERLQAAQAYCNYKVVLNQVHYNLVVREAEQELLSFCQANDVILQAWRPLNKGGIIDAECKILDELCLKYDKTKTQIALNWLLSQNNVATLATMRSRAHLESNLEALGWSLSEQDIELLRQKFPNQKSISDVVPLS